MRAFVVFSGTTEVQGCVVWEEVSWVLGEWWVCECVVNCSFTLFKYYVTNDT